MFSTCSKESPISIEVPGSVPIPAGATLVNPIKLFIELTVLGNEYKYY